MIAAPDMYRKARAGVLACAAGPKHIGPEFRLNDSIAAIDGTKGWTSCDADPPFRAGLERIFAPFYIFISNVAWGPGNYRAGPGRAEPSRAGPGRAGPSRAEPSRAEPSQAEPSRPEPSRAEPSRAEPLTRAEPSKHAPPAEKIRPRGEKLICGGLDPPSNSSDGSFQCSFQLTSVQGLPSKQQL